jgi:hypothetical protein
MTIQKFTEEETGLEQVRIHNQDGSIAIMTIENYEAQQVEHLTEIDPGDE